MIKLNAFERKKAISQKRSATPIILSLLFCLLLTIFNFHAILSNAKKTFSKKNTGSDVLNPIKKKLAQNHRKTIELYKLKIDLILKAQQFNGKIISSLLLIKKQGNIGISINKILMDEKKSRIVITGILSQKNLKKFIEYTEDDPKIKILSLNTPKSNENNMIFTIAVKYK